VTTCGAGAGQSGKAAMGHGAGGGKCPFAGMMGGKAEAAAGGGEPTRQEKKEN
jgi:hypothetical protein